MQICTVRGSSFCPQRQFLPASIPYLGPECKLSGTPDTADETPTDTRVLEIERKFVPSSRTYKALGRQIEWPGPELVKRLPPRSGYALTDIYHDTAERNLIRARMHVGQRNNEWQMKVRRTGDLVSTGCIEVCGQAQVDLALRQERGVPHVAVKPGASGKDGGIEAIMENR